MDDATVDASTSTLMASDANGANGQEEADMEVASDMQQQRVDIRQSLVDQQSQLMGATGGGVDSLIPITSGDLAAGAGVVQLSLREGVVDAGVEGDEEDDEDAFEGYTYPSPKKTAKQVVAPAAAVAGKGRGAPATGLETVPGSRYSPLAARTPFSNSEFEDSCDSANGRGADPPARQSARTSARRSNSTPGGGGGRGDGRGGSGGRGGGRGESPSAHTSAGKRKPANSPPMPGSKAKKFAKKSEQKPNKVDATKPAPPVAQPAATPQNHNNNNGSSSQKIASETAPAGAAATDAPISLTASAEASSGAPSADSQQLQQPATGHQKTTFNILAALTEDLDELGVEDRDKFQRTLDRVGGLIASMEPVLERAVDIAVEKRVKPLAMAQAATEAKVRDVEGKTLMNWRATRFNACVKERDEQ